MKMYKSKTTTINGKLTYIIYQLYPELYISKSSRIMKLYLKLFILINFKIHK